MYNETYTSNHSFKSYFKTQPLQVGDNYSYYHDNEAYVNIFLFGGNILLFKATRN